MSTLHTFVHRADLDGVVNCLDRHDQIYMNEQDSSGMTALHHAVEKGELAIARLLIQRDCRLDIPDKNGDTVVHMAVRNDRYSMLKYMLARTHVDVDARNHSGESAIDLASLLSSGKCHRLLCKHIGELGTTANQLSTELTTSQQLAKQRRRKIRERLAKAQHTSARDWQMLFSDCSDVNGNVVDRPSSGSTSRRREKTMSSSQSLEKVRPVPCACAPMLYRLQEEQGKAHTSLLDELDACHHELTAEIKQLRHMTELRLATLQQRLEAERRAKGAGQSAWACQGSDESDVEIKGRRPMTTDSGDSDDAHAVINAGRQKHQGRPSKPRNNIIAWSMNEFNRQLLLDESCTTPTTVSTHSGGHSLARRSAATTTTTTSSVASEPDDVQLRREEPRRQRAPVLYHKTPDEMALVMAPSVDSGYDMGGTMASSSRSPESGYAELVIPPPPCKPLPPTPGQRTNPPRATRRLHA